MGANANAATAIPELIQIASNPAFEENRKDKHNKNAKYGWLPFLSHRHSIFNTEHRL